jgi:hypothetical protein
MGQSDEPTLDSVGRLVLAIVLSQSELGKPPICLEERCDEKYPPARTASQRCALASRQHRAAAQVVLLV